MVNLPYALGTEMSKHSAFSPAEVFAVINDPRYNALRLHLMTEQETDARFNLNESGAPLGDGKHDDVVKRSERT
jgi:hypothetical protein